MEGRYGGPPRKLGFSPPPPEAPRVNLHKPRGHFFGRRTPPVVARPGGIPAPARRASGPVQRETAARFTLARALMRGSPRSSPRGSAVPPLPWMSPDPVADPEHLELGSIREAVPVGVGFVGRRSRRGRACAQTDHGIVPTTQWGPSNRAARSRTIRSSSADSDPGRPARGQPCLRGSY
jgi:hypothetical protein